MECWEEGGMGRQKNISDKKGVRKCLELAAWRGLLS
jgi:hypothetical protein